MARNISDQRFSAAFIKYRQKLHKPRKHYFEIAIIQMRCSMLFQGNKDPITLLEARLGGVPFLQNLLSIYERRLYLNDEELAGWLWFVTTNVKNASGIDLKPWLIQKLSYERIKSINKCTEEKRAIIPDIHSPSCPLKDIQLAAQCEYQFLPDGQTVLTPHGLQSLLFVYPQETLLPPT